MAVAVAAMDPAPDYAGLDSRDALRRAMAEDAFARLLDAQLPRPARVLDIGCGAGRLTNFLGLSWARTVIGVDIDPPLLRAGEAWRARFSVRNAHFVAADPAALPFREGAFDMVVADGLLDGVADAAAGFRAIARFAKPGGWLAVGVANRLRRLAFWRQSPMPTRYSLNQVLGWFAASGFDYTASLPTIGDREATPDMKLFEPQPAGGAAACLSSELEMVLRGARAGRCIVVGRRRG